MASQESKVSFAPLSKPRHPSPGLTADYGSSSMDTEGTAHAALNNRVSVYFANSNTQRRRDYWVSDAGDARMSLANQRAAKTSGAHGGDRFGGRNGTKKLQRQHTVYYKDLQKLKDAVNNEEVASGTAVVKPIHYKPDWFPVSVRQIDRDGNKVRTGLNGQPVNQASQVDEETREVCQMIEKVLVLRDKWIYQPKKGVVGANKSIDEITFDVDKARFDKDESKKWSFSFSRGVAHVFNKQTKKEEFDVFSFEEYMADLGEVLRLMSNGPTKTHCYRRLQILQSRFQLHLWLNSHVETAEVKSVPHRDFYNVRKVDNHVHHSACMHQV